MGLGLVAAKLIMLWGLAPRAIIFTGSWQLIRSTAWQGGCPRDMETHAQPVPVPCQAKRRPASLAPRFTWDIIRRHRSASAVVLTTHSMEVWAGHHRSTCRSCLAA